VDRMEYFCVFDPVACFTGVRIMFFFKFLYIHFIHRICILMTAPAFILFVLRPVREPPVRVAIKTDNGFVVWNLGLGWNYQPSKN